LNVNHKVGRIRIRLKNDNPINDTIIRVIMNRCHNIYCIEVYDHNDLIDSSIHHQIQQLLE